MKILGIDYGLKRVGIAISNEEQSFVFPKTVLENNSQLVTKILEIVKQENISRIVLGESKNYKMEDNKIMKQINNFKEKLESENIEVIFHPEFMSSVQVEKIMGEKNKMIDASAATIILQDYLDSVKK